MTTTTINKKEDLNSPGLEANMEIKPQVIKESYKARDELEGKIALITGGDSGIGRAVAVHFAREGAKAAITLSETQDAKDTQEMIEKEGSECIALEGDLRDFGFCRELIEKVVDKFGSIDILLNNAATQYPETNFTDISVEHLKETFNTNIVSMIYLTQKAFPHMESGPRIINTTSITGYRGHDTLIDYASAKGAITSFTRALSQQLAPKKIPVNGVAPGPIWTPLIPATMDVIEDFGENHPLGRCGQPSEVALAYVYLASEDSTYMTGQALHINGGVIIGG